MNNEQAEAPMKDLKDFCCIILALYSSYIALSFISFFVGSWLNPYDPNDLEKFEIPNSVTPLFNYLAAGEIGPDSEVHETFPLQVFLRARNYDIGPCGTDGIYGESMKNAVLQYQKDNNLKPSEIRRGDATIETLQHMKMEIAADPNLRARLDKILIEPFRTPEVTAFLKRDAPDILNWSYGTSFLFRPDLGIPAAVVVLDTDRESGAKKAYPGCVDGNTHRRDAFRHAQTVFNMTQIVGPEWAVAIGNLREKNNGVSHTLPESLMDVYNHKIAAEIAEEVKGTNAGTDAVIAENIHNGRFLTYPFPMVPKTYAAPTELSTVSMR